MAEEPRTKSAAGDHALCPNCLHPRDDMARPCPHCGALGVADEGQAADAREPGARGADTLTAIRASDIEPYIGLRYLSKLFRLMAVILILLLVAEVVTGVMSQGRAAIPTLLAEASRLIVLAGLLWGAGDLAILLIDVGHDVRAARILLARQISHHVTEHHPAAPPLRDRTVADRRAGEPDARP